MIRTKILRQLEYDKNARTKQLRYLVQSDTGTSSVENIMQYNELCDIVENQLEQLNGNNDETLWAFKNILAHEGRPLKPTDKNYKGCKLNLLIDWDGYESGWEPRTIIEASDMISVATYAKTNNLLNLPGWKKYYKRKLRTINKANTLLRSAMKSKRFITGPKYNYGVQLPDRANKWQELDRKNGNSLWRDAHTYEIGKYNKYKVHHSVGPVTPQLLEQHLSDGYQLIDLVWSYAVTHDCAGGHTTYINENETAYSSVVSLRTLRTMVLLAELNGLKLMTADVESAYLLAHTKEKICFIAGKEFGDHAGDLMVIDRACYGLRTSGKRYHDFFYDVMQSSVFNPRLPTLIST